MTALQFVVLFLAVHRATHLIVEDHIPLVARPRGWVTGRWPESNVAYLVSCFWCSSAWVAAAAVGLLYAWTPSGWDGVAMPLALGAALSSAATALESLLQLLDARSLQ
jgi:hypothetical protein